MAESKNKIQFIDLGAQQKAIYPKLEERIRKVLSHGQYIMGPEVSELEQKLAAFVGVKHALSCSSGTDALLIPLMAYGVGPGDLIFTTPFTFIATAEVIAILGATPVFVDIDPETFNIDPAKLELAVRAVKERDSRLHPLPSAGIRTGQPRGIIPVDLFGLCADYEPINRIAGEHNLFVLEDAAQSFGALYHGKRAGSLADVAATSFFPAKPLGCYGDGGAIFTNDDGLADTMKSIRVHGQGATKYDNVRIGVNGRLDTLQAAILLEKLAIFPQEIEARNRVAARYSEELRGAVKTPRIPEGCMSVWAQYSVIADKRRELLDALQQNGIPTAIYYPKPLHRQDAFAYLGYRQGDFPVSDTIAEGIFSLPIHPYLQDEQIRAIGDIARSAVGA